MNAPVIDPMQEFRLSVYERMAAAGTGAEIDPVAAMEKRSASFQRLLSDSTAEQLILPPTLLRHWIAADLTDFKDLDSKVQDKGAAILHRNEAAYAAYAEARRGIDEPFYTELRPSPKRIDWAENGFAPSAATTGEAVKPVPKLTELLDNVSYRAQKDGSVLYLINDQAAFTDYGHQILMAKGKENNDEAVLAAMMLAKEKFGGKFDVTGSDEFKRYAITLMLQNGLSVELNSPAQNALRDEIAAQLNLNASAPSQTNSSSQTNVTDTPTKPGPTAASEQPSAGPSSPIPQPAPIDRHTGTVIDFGSAPYEHNERNSKSFFIKLENSDGNTSTTWGVDLARVVEEQKIGRGDSVTLNNLGRQPVTINENVLDDNGKVIGTREVETHRNAWEATLLSRAPSPIVEADRVWLSNIGVPEQQLMAIPEYAALRAQDHAPRILFGGDETEEGKRHVSSLLANHDYRASFSATIDSEFERLSKALQREAQESGFLEAAYKLLSDAEHKYGPIQQSAASVESVKPAPSGPIDVPGAIAIIEQVDRAFIAAKGDTATAAASLTASGNATATLATPPSAAAEPSLNAENAAEPTASPSSSQHPSTRPRMKH